MRLACHVVILVPKQTRYSYLLNLVFVAMTYSGGMFAMNVLTFMFLFITYWVDKAMLLRFYRRPPHREDALQRQVFTVVTLFKTTMIPSMSSVLMGKCSQQQFSKTPQKLWNGWIEY